MNASGGMKLCSTPSSPPASPAKCRGDDEHRKLVARHGMTEHGRAGRVLLDRTQHHTERRVDDASGKQKAGKEKRRQKPVHRSPGMDALCPLAESEGWLWHARQAIFAAGEGGQWIVLEEEGHLAERQRDHGEVDADTTHRQPADEQPSHGRGNRADGQRDPDAAEQVVNQQVGGDEPPGAEECRLSE